MKGKRRRLPEFLRVGLKKEVGKGTLEVNSRLIHGMPGKEGKKGGGTRF